MKIVLLKAALATCLSIIASLAICWFVLSMAGSEMDWFPVIMSALCPLLIAFPASTYTFYQNHRIALAHAQLEAAHKELADVHGDLAIAARTDGMTGLLNRSSFIADLDEIGQRGTGGVLLVIDADDFKAINDTHGHLIGDRALCSIASVIRDAVGDTGIAARIGGEEFGVFVEAASLDDGLALAEKVRLGVEQLVFRPTWNEITALSVSVGVAFAETKADFSSLMAVADDQLYRAKRSGRNRICAPQLRGSGGRLRAAIG
ncbi:GGDEF domain-containing protein [Nitratireductor soli]|uniref:GGDEF domain-containing protein n=1 Tax=Nitratireductor soli TaxID=1670619 RepID=UPI00065DE038|nr:GGDEF domain-containing protein [Nitratireductor soli]